MARHRTPDEKRELGERAREMRARGVPRPAVKAALGIGSALLQELLLDAEPAPRRRWSRLDGRRERAVALRQAGATYATIAEQLGVSTSTCSLWLGDVQRGGPELQAELRQRRLEAQQRRAASTREANDRRRGEVAAAAASRVGPVSSRDLVLAVAVAYWCEGAKRKPWRRSVAVTWMNSDPSLVRLYLEGLRELGVEGDQLSFRLQIHESADEQAARRWWAATTGYPEERFARSTIKRHNPRTSRRNTDGEYRGCLCVTVQRPGGLYDVLEGVVTGLVRNERAAAEWHDDADRAPVPA